MESRLQMTVSGQSAYLADINLLGENAALADDRVLAELFRIAPRDGSTIAKAVIPYGVSGWESAAAPTRTIVLPGTGKVIVNPFRAIIGSRTLASAGGLANWRDIRSAIQVGTTTLEKSDLTLDACGAGVWRWDLIYAAVSIDANYVTADRKVKDGATGNVTTSSLVTQVKTTVAVDKVTGTAAVSPTRPALPSDTATTYYIALAYVKVPQNFGGATTLARTDIWEVSPQVALSSTSGAATMRSASGNWDTAGAVEARCPWTALQRPEAYIPSTMAGEETVLAPIDFWGGTRTASHNSGDVIDQSRDWSKRVWDVVICGEPSTSTPYFAWQTSSTTVVPGKDNDVYRGVGQSFKGDGSAATKAVVAYLDPTSLPCMNAGSTATIYVDLTTGALHVEYTGSPNCRVVCWLRASGQYVNAG